MMDYEKIVKAIIDPIVEDSDSVLLRVNEEEKDVLIIESFDDERKED